VKRGRRNPERDAPAFGVSAPGVVLTNRPETCDR
jgi:hypothetical protein